MPSVTPLLCAIRTLRNIHTEMEGEKTTSLPSKSSASPRRFRRLFFLLFPSFRPGHSLLVYPMPLIIPRCAAAVAACSIENGIISERPLILPRFAVVASVDKRKEGWTGRKNAGERGREMRRKARDRQMPSGRNSNFCADA